MPSTAVGCDAECRERQRSRGDDVVALQQLYLVGGQRRVRQNRHQPRLQSGDAERKSTSSRLRRISLEQQFDQLAEGVDLGAAELVGAAGGCRILEAFEHSVGDIADIDRLKPGLARRQ